MATAFADPFLTYPIASDRLRKTDYRSLQRLLADLRAAIGRNDLDAGLSALYVALKVVSDDIEGAMLRSSLVFFLAAKGELDKAKHEMRQAERVARLNQDVNLRTMILLARGGLLAAEGDVAASKRMYQRALRLVSTFSIASRLAFESVISGLKAGLHAQEGQWGKAAEALSKAQELALKTGQDEMKPFVELMERLLDDAYEHLAEEAWREKPSVDTEMKYVSDHRQEFEQNYPNQWLAIDGERVVAHGRSLKRVMERARKQGAAHPLIIGTRAREYQEHDVVA